jgi:hypothetical protein
VPGERSLVLSNRTRALDYRDGRGTADRGETSDWTRHGPAENRGGSGRRRSKKTRRPPRRGVRHQLWKACSSAEPLPARRTRARASSRRHPDAADCVPGPDRPFGASGWIGHGRRLGSRKARPLLTRVACRTWFCSCTMAKLRRRTYTAEYMQAPDPQGGRRVHDARGDRRPCLGREGLYSSHLVECRRPGRAANWRG